MKKVLKIILIFSLFFIFNINAYAENFDDVTSKNIILISLKDDSVIYERNSEDEVNIASLTKIMTIFVSVCNIENYDEEILITNDMLDGLASDLSVVGFEVGEVVTYDDLLYGTLLKSGADATHILALQLAGSEEEFAKLMNQKAEELGMENSSFANSYGIEQEGHYSSAKDISILLKNAIKNEKFYEIFTTKHYVTENEKHDMYGPLNTITDEEKMDMTYVLGAKTGYTKSAGLCLASVAINNGVEYILVTIGAEHNSAYQAMEDSKEIYEYYFDNYNYLEILKKGDVIVNEKDVYGNEYEILSNNTIEKYLDVSVNKEDLVYKFDKIVNLDNNVNKNDKIGTFYILYNDEILYEEDIFSNIDIHMPLKYFIVNNKILLCILWGSIILLLLLLINMRSKMKKKRKKKIKKIY